MTISNNNDNDGGLEIERNTSEQNVHVFSDENSESLEWQDRPAVLWEKDEGTWNVG